MNRYNPEAECHGGHLSTESQIVVRNCRLSYLAVTEAVLDGLWSPNTKAKVCNKRSRHGDCDVHVQLQARGSDYLKCVHLTLSQVGNDVAARLDAAAYTSLDHEIGFYFPTPIPIAANQNGSGYGVAKLFYSTSFFGSMTGMRCLSDSFNGFVSAKETVIAANINIKQLNVTGAILGGAWAPDTDAQAVCIRRSEAEMSVQLQAECDDFLKCVHVVFRQSGNDVTARVDWAASLPSEFGSCGFDFSQVEFVQIATNANEPGYGVSKLSFVRKSLFEIGTGVIQRNNPRIQIIIRTIGNIPRSDVRIGLHWLRDDNGYGGFITDKVPTDNGYGCVSAEFSFDEITQKIIGISECPSRFLPVVYFTIDGSFDNAWFKTDLNGALKTEDMVISLFSKMQATLSKKWERARDERRAHEIKNTAYVYIDGNNFCWDNRDADCNKKNKQKGKNRSKKKTGTPIGIARIDFVLRELKKEESRSLFPNAKIRLFFDGGITHLYRVAFLERLNDGNVRVCAEKADPDIMKESEENGAAEKTFVVSNDHFDDYLDYSVVRNGRVIRPVLDNCTVRIPGLMDKPLDFNPDHWAHLPVKGNPFTQDVCIQAHSNGMFLCADNPQQSNACPILANRKVFSNWEKFTVIQNDDGTISIRSKANGKYLTAMVDSDGQLMALADKIDLWEKFWLTKRMKGLHYILRSHANMKYVTAYRDNGFVAARADVADEWEWFTIAPC